jgi:flagellar FliL protein
MSLRCFLFFLGLTLAGVVALPALAEEAENSNDNVEAADKDATPKPSIYVEMTPPFITNAGASKGRQSFVKAEVTLRVASKAAQQAVEKHGPRLRHEMVMLLAAKDRDTLSSSQGQEALRTEALEEFNAVLGQEQTAATIDDVLFTSFVVQR